MEIINSFRVRFFTKAKILATAQATGRVGEEIATRYLQQEGFRILERNWRLGKAEIDIIARDQEALVFVEVKTRSKNLLGPPEAFLSPRQAQLIAAAAAAYMEKINYDWELRFDVISILLDQEGDYQIKHLKDAFFPGFDD